MRLFYPTVDMLFDVAAFAPPPTVALRPQGFVPLGPVPPGPGTLALDTRTLAVSGGGRGTLHRDPVTGVETAVFCFASGLLAGPVVVWGTRPAAVLFHGDVLVTAQIDACAAGARAGGPGVGAHPGGGGGFGGAGGASPHGRGGASYGLDAGHLGGSGGQSGSALGGRGGGALQIGASRRLLLDGAHVRAAGFAGEPADAGTAGGGGSGGALVLHGSEVRLDRTTRLDVRGGAGGAGTRGADGGGGGGGGLVLGICDGGRIFDPGGAEIACDGGAGGPAASPGLPGSAGAHGVALLSARHRAARSRIPWPRMARPS